MSLQKVAKKLVTVRDVSFHEIRVSPIFVLVLFLPR